MPSVDLWQVGLLFLQASLLSIGGANAVIPELHRVMVEDRGWMAEADFVALFALGQAAPGPNVIAVVLFGQKLCGIAGGILAITAMCVPTSIATYWFYRVWDRFKGTPWHRAVQGGLAPVTVGLVLSTGLVLPSAGRLEVVSLVITVGSMACMLLTKLNPLWCLAAGALAAMVLA